jgi:hypothetical protein
MHEHLYDKVEEMLTKVVGGYDGHHDDVRALIVECREALGSVDGKVGPWETQELEYADSAVNANMLRLALVATEKALDVSQLPADEYEYGFTYGRRTA